MYEPVVAIDGRIVQRRVGARERERERENESGRHWSSPCTQWRKSSEMHVDERRKEKRKEKNGARRKLFLIDYVQWMVIGGDRLGPLLFNVFK
jgi:hypothetical protein